MVNEREGIDVLKGVYSYTCAREDTPILCKFIVSGPLTTHQFSAQSVQSLPKYGRGGGHVPTCTPPLASIKRLADGFIIEIDMDMDIHGYPRISI